MTPAHLVSLGLALAVTLAPRPAAAEDPGALELTAAAALVIPGAIYVEPYTWDTGVGLGANLGLDYRVAPRLSAGLVAQYTATTLTELDVGAKAAGLGASLKVLLGDPRAIHFKVGVNVLYQLDWIDAKGADDAHGLGLGLLVEGLYPVAPRSSLVGQLGFVTQPSGGNPSAEVTWGPLFFLGVGVAFGP
ncbi:MAG: hypothetical protein U0229_17980 [Anaeromyxobacter sp.]